jgi:polyhydroxyalkanoate synthesis regulator phasin
MDMTKDKVEKFIGDVKKDRHITKEESRKAVDNLVSRFRVSKQDLTGLLRKQVRAIVKELGLVTKDDLKKLEKKAGK